MKTLGFYKPLEFKTIELKTLNKPIRFRGDEPKKRGGENMTKSDLNNATGIASIGILILGLISYFDGKKEREVKTEKREDEHRKKQQEYYDSLNQLREKQEAWMSRQDEIQLKTLSLVDHLFDRLDFVSPSPTLTTKKMKVKR